MPASPVLTLLLALLVPGGEPVPPAALVRVEQGRAELVRDGLRRELYASDGELEVGGPAELAVRPGSRASVRWPGRASARVQGPGVLEWTPDAEDRPLRWSLSGRGSFELEVRGPAVAAELAPGWRTILAGGAWRLEGLPGGVARFEHRAGPPVELRWWGPDRLLYPPVRLGPGQERRLVAAAPAAPRPDRSRPAAWPAAQWPWGLQPASEQERSWSRASWPWGEALAHQAPITSDWSRVVGPWRIADGELLESAPLVDARVALEERAHADCETVETIEQVEPIELVDSVEPVEPFEPAEAAEPAHPIEPTEPTDPAPLDEPGPAAPPAASAEVPPAPDEPLAPTRPWTPTSRPSSPEDHDPWRGLSAETRRTQDGLVFERSVFLEILRRADGYLLVTLDTAAPRGAWVLTGELDLHLDPGAAVLLDALGRLWSQAGRVRVLTPLRERQASSRYSSSSTRVTRPPWM